MSDPQGLGGDPWRPDTEDDERPTGTDDSAQGRDLIPDQAQQQAGEVADEAAQDV